MGQPYIFSRALPSQTTTSIAASQTPGAAIPLTINGGLAVGGKATIGSPVAGFTGIYTGQRRITIHSNGNDSALTWTVKGLNDSGQQITDTFLGGNAADANSNLDFSVVTSITPSVAPASSVFAGTNGGVGSSPWWIVNWNAYPNNIGIGLECRLGSATVTIEHAYDDPNNLLAGLPYPYPFQNSAINNSAMALIGATTLETSYNSPITALRLTTNTGTGTIWFRGLQNGLGSP